MILSQDTEIGPDQFTLSIINDDQDPTDKNFKIEEIEKNTIREVLKSCNGNMTLAAKELGYARSTLYRKIEKYGL